MGFHLVVVDNYSRGLGSSVLRAVTRGGMCSGIRRLRKLAGHQWGAGAHAWGCTDCVQEGAGPEEVLQHVDDRVADRVEHLDGQVSPHGARSGACT